MEVRLLRYRFTLGLSL
ncbi:hypothetical protein Goshw_010921 [Gossypium schwendimanii]|uniref:Uncharacterized protein n=1 Tax=Gossypium schwendimanii TaxID=34291 RepID=A0A7J9M3D0_GOSSC|nr:hypothetical protein [Gossypium schwendimanii]